VQIALILFSAAYLAETIRAGLQALPRGQLEASAALGLGRWQATRLVVLPQALRLVVPPLVGSLVSTIKDTSLVVIVSLYDLTGALRLAIGDPAWRGFHIEGYLFVGAVYFILCYSLSRYARWLERRLRDRA
jgi:general L-amino acid transport system permease protein